MKNLCLALLLVIATNTHLAAQASDPTPLRAGTARIDITPPQTKYPVHDRLWARSLILDSGDTRVGFIAYDNAGYANDKLLAALKQKHNLDELFFCQSHTHSGAWGDPKSTAALFTQVLDEAAAGMFDARISGGWRSFPQLSFQRLVVREDGWAKESWEGDDHYRAVNPERIPHGPVDPTVGVLRIDDASGAPRVVVMNYACHPDVVWSNFEVSADYVGYATAHVERVFDGAVNCLFVQGGAGNQAPLFKDGGRSSPDDPRPANYDLIERMGKLLGIETAKLVRELYPNPHDTPSLAVRSDSVVLRPRYLPEEGPADGLKDRAGRKKVAHFAVVVIDGRYSIATFPGEPFIKFQIDWKREMGVEGRIPFFFGYSWSGGSSPGYVPDVRSAALGGFGAVNNLEIGTGERIMTRNLENFYWIEGRFRPTPPPAPHPFE